MDKPCCIKHLHISHRILYITSTKALYCQEPKVKHSNIFQKKRAQLSSAKKYVRSKEELYNL